MATNRSLKRQLKRRQNDDARLKRRRTRAGEILRQIGVESLLKDHAFRVVRSGQKTSLWEVLLTAANPRPAIDLDADCLGDRTAEPLRQELEGILGDVEFECDPIGRVTVRDFFVHVVAMKDVVSGVELEDQGFQSAQSLLTAAGSALNAVLAVRAVHQAFEEPLLRASRIDLRLFHVQEVHQRLDRDHWGTRFRLCRTPSQSIRVPLDGATRIAYRCGQQFYEKGIRWVTWPDENSAPPQGASGRPVYVQSHVLEQLYGRSGRLNFLVDGEWLIHEHLWRSLLNPVIQPALEDRRNSLVDFRLGGHKVGYLVATPQEDKVVVRTFLFLTMDGTPEGRELRRRLGIARADREWLELDKLITFLNSDIQLDPELVRIFEECGCGHLFQMLKDPPCPSELFQLAASVRQYLDGKLPPNG